MNLLHFAFLKIQNWGRIVKKVVDVKLMLSFG